MIDSIQVYGKTKESFGWPEDADQLTGTNGSSGALNLPPSHRHMFPKSNGPVEWIMQQNAGPEPGSTDAGSVSRWSRRPFFS